MHKIVIFGTGDLALLACLSLRGELGREIAAFTVERSFMTAARFCDAEVIPFELLASRFPAGSCELLIALGPGQRNRLRERIFLAAQAMNYEFATYVHPSVRVHPSVGIGRNCLVFESVSLQPFARLGDNVVIRPLSYIGHHATIAAHSFVGPGAKLLGHSEVGERVFVGAGAVLGPGVAVGADSVISANAAALESLPARSVLPPCTATGRERE